MILLKVGKSVHNGDWNWKNVRSPFFRIYYVVEGMASLEIEGTTYQLQQDNVYVIPPFALHSTSCLERFVHYYTRKGPLRVQGKPFLVYGNLRFGFK